MPNTHASHASQRPFFYTIEVVDSSGRSIGHEELPRPMTRTVAFRKLLTTLSEVGKSDNLIYGDHLVRDERNRA